MHLRALELVQMLGLNPHPEGGHYRESFRSAYTVQPSDKRGPRSALTTIYFLLVEGEHSCWHRVTSDEVWHFYEGAALELCQLDPGIEEYKKHLVGPIIEESRTQIVIPAGYWQAARTTGAYSLAGCTVGPGFDFADFQMLRDHAEETAALKKHFPELAGFL